METQNTLFQPEIRIRERSKENTHFTFRVTSCCLSFTAAVIVLESGPPQMFLSE